jgi:hypothetical protein
VLELTRQVKKCPMHQRPLDALPGMGQHRTVGGGQRWRQVWVKCDTQY